ncbi:DNA starvation/stationary phase protection protein Dps [Paracoccus seriniphilus]|uniref:Starvation-inducible DNA-binding protein n=1 Tax=Paracoccus seriniphilus TaxID=184748 RepID=A0A239PLW7_9RHOB|nr:DNA starvation/stationary phase protection protein Dps [Paracoccus seriniphilus]WCR13618.1 DNA starvation/stationary phase protection protein Dps [Paracoccus seriniphilus]SNT68788.1 starvation-inducible DNA-binding protein [Paracoccus seriniphilus]
MAVKIQGLKDNARKTAVSELNARLADSLALSMAIKQAHWNVKGPGFIAVHELLDSVYANLQEHIDVMAERVQILDGVAQGTAEVVAKNTTLKEYPTDLTSTADHLKAICERMRDHGGKLRAAIDTTDEAGDANTADIFTAASRTADKDLWFLESHLE